MQLSSIIDPSSIAGKWLHKRRQEKSLREQEQSFARITAIAAEYGYPADSVAVRAVWDGNSPSTRADILHNFKEEEWRDSFNPSAPQHIDYRDDVLVVMHFPMSITLAKRKWGPSRADIVRAHLNEGWHGSCDRIVIQSHEMTFFSGEKPLVVFYASGRKMHGGSWARTWNAIDAIKSIIGIEIDPNDVAIPDCSNYPDYVIEKKDDTWTWPTRRTT
jgi:hypothetical protein